jgi:hypothetical protein
MKFSHLQRKSISLIVLVTFVALLHFWAAPALAATNAKKPETSMERVDRDGSSFMEQESSAVPVIKKAKKFPWLIVGLGTVVVGVALFFLIKSSGPKFANIQKKGDIVGVYNYCGGVPCGYTAIFHVQNVGASGEINVTVTVGSYTETKSFTVQSNAKYHFNTSVSTNRYTSATDTLTVKLPGLTLTEEVTQVTGKPSSTMNVITE